jgi:hypothetical protein
MTFSWTPRTINLHRSRSSRNRNLLFLKDKPHSPSPFNQAPLQLSSSNLLLRTPSIHSSSRLETWVGSTTTSLEVCSFSSRSRKGSLLLLLKEPLLSSSKSSIPLHSPSVWATSKGPSPRRIYSKSPNSSNSDIYGMMMPLVINREAFIENMCWHSRFFSSLS